LFATDLGMFEAERYYLLGRIALTLNDGSDALRYAVKLERIDGTAAAWPLASDLALELRARVARKRGKAEQALALLTPMHRRPSWRVMFVSPFFGETDLRFLRADLLQEAGRYQEALAWYGTFGWHSSADFIYRATIRARRASIDAWRAEHGQ
jgi:tetratricopeptide (TPR) repeat protein